MNYPARLTACIWFLSTALGLSYVHAQDYDLGLNPHAAFSNSDIDHINLSTGNVVGTIPLVSYPQRGHLPPLTFSAIFNTNPWHIEGTCDPYGDQCVAYYVVDTISPIGNMLGATVQSNFKSMALVLCPINNLHK
jgi:hypothetical protein